MVKYELPARIVLSLFTVIPLFFAYSTLQSSQPLLFISMLLASVLFLVTQLNIKQFLMPKRQPNAKLLNMQKALGTASVVLLMLNIAFKDIMLFQKNLLFCPGKIKKQRQRKANEEAFSIAFNFFNPFYLSF